MELKEALEKLYDESSDTLTALLGNKFQLQDKERWVNLGVGELTKTDRRYKLFQMGNLGMSQPTGGFQSATSTIHSFIAQMHKLITSEPTFVICTEPFQKPFFDAFPSDPSNPLYYEVVGTLENSRAGILSNQKFTYSVLSESSNMVLFTLNGVNVLHWHGSSKGTTQKTLLELIELGRSHAPVIFLGDSNITKSKLQLQSSEHPLEDMLQEQQLTHTCSRIKMSKTRIPDNILYNNQITKGGQTSDAEIDGMFISVIPSEAFVPEPFVPDSTIHYAFTEYSKENPVIADHSVVKQKIGDDTFVCVNTASIDDPQKGFLTKKEWEGIDLQAFAKEVALPYTYKWVTQLYPTFHEKMKLHGNYTPNKDDQEVEDFIAKYTTTHDPQGQLIPNFVEPLQLHSPNPAKPLKMPIVSGTRKRRWDYFKEITGFKKGGSKKRKRLRSKRRKTSMKKRLL